MGAEGWGSFFEFSGLSHNILDNRLPGRRIVLLKFEEEKPYQTFSEKFSHTFHLSVDIRS